MSEPAVVVQSELLLLRHRAGDRAALAELIALWERPLLYYLRRLLDSEEDAWDALQETWMRAVRDLGRRRDERAFAAWIYTIARNTAFSAHRRRRPTEPLDDHAEAAAVPADASAPSLAGWAPGDLHRALARLSLAHRDVLTLHFLEGFTIAQIGVITGVANGTVKSRLHYARHAMRDLLEGGMR